MGPDPWLLKSFLPIYPKVYPSGNLQILGNFQLCEKPRSSATEGCLRTPDPRQLRVASEPQILGN